jgi:hypothetical protein
MARSDIKRAPSGPAITAGASPVTAEYQRMVAEAAYYRALERGFRGGDPVDDWIQAEKQISRTLRTSSKGH